jgi:hypothetical protein
VEQPSHEAFNRRDRQALWIDPTNPKRVLSGSDGGFQVNRIQTE